MNTSTIGLQTEARILSDLVNTGHQVFIPFGETSRSDFIIDNGFGLVRAQCKTGRLRNGVVIWDTASREKNWATGTSSNRGYTDDIDVFLVYCPETDQTYSVPVGMVAKGKARLRLEPTRNGQSKGVKYAEDYKL